MVCIRGRWWAVEAQCTHDFRWLVVPTSSKSLDCSKLNAFKQSMIGAYLSLGTYISDLMLFLKDLSTATAVVAAALPGRRRPASRETHCRRSAIR